MTEEWRAAPGTDGWYDVSSLGRVRSWHNNRHGRARTPKIVKLNGNGNGYIFLRLRESDRRKKLYVHRMVAEAFLGESTLEVNHINGLRLDNRLCNLEYVTHSVNMKHAVMVLGGNRGTIKKVSKLTEKDVQEIRRRVRLGELHRVIAKDFGVSRGHVGDIANGDKWGWLEEP